MNIKISLFIYLHQATALTDTIVGKERNAAILIFSVFFSYIANSLFTGSHSVGQLALTTCLSMNCNVPWPLWVSAWVSVMANLGFQFAHIWNQLKPREKNTPVRGYS